MGISGLLRWPALAIAAALSFSGLQASSAETLTIAQGNDILLHLSAHKQLAAGGFDHAIRGAQ